MIKKIFAIFLSLFCATSAFADSEKEVFIYPDVLEHVLKDAFAGREQEMSAFGQAFNQHLTETGMINQSGLRAACNAAGWNSEMCGRVVDILLTRFYSVCDKGVSVKSGECVQLFNSATVRIPEGVALAKEYLLKNYGIKAVCSSDIRGTRYLKCSSVDNFHKFEFNFGNLDTTEDNSILHSVLNAVGQIHGVQTLTGISDISAITKDGDDGFAAYNVSDYKKCSEINNTLQKMGYESKIVKNSKAKQNYTDWVSAKYGLGIQAKPLLKQQNLPHPDDVSDNLCTVSGIVRTTGELRTAYGIDNYVFANGVYAQMDMSIEAFVKKYLNEYMGKKNIVLESFSCDYSTGHIMYKGERDEVLTCYVNSQPVDFVFPDLSEWKRKFRRAGKQAMDCIIEGGEYTGKRCMHLDEDACLKLRAANIESCPECRLVEWDPENEICTLPDGAAATRHEKSLNIALMVGGTLLSAVVSFGTGDSPAIVVVETVGGVIEMIAQYKINGMADDFFVESNKCQDAVCAESLIKEHLVHLARIENELTKTEALRIDSEMARLAEIIPTESEFYRIIAEQGLSGFDDGGYNAAEVWRAVGIAMQFAGVTSSITGWIIKKTGYLEKTLDRTSKILLNSAKTAEKNIVKVDKLDDVGKEWYNLWQEYASKNQTLEQFKAMTNGNLDEMKQMAKDWIPRSKRVTIIKAQIDKQLDDITAEVQRRSTTFENLMDKYNIDALPADPNELAQLYKQHPDLEQAFKTLEYARAQEIKLQDAKINYIWGTNYSTFDPEFSRTMESQIKIDKLKKEREDLMSESWIEADGTPEIVEKKVKNSQRIDEIDKEIEELKKSVPTQWEVAEKHQLQNLGNITSERAKQFEEIIKNNPEIQSKLDEKVWARLSDQERVDVAQKIMDEYAAKTGTPRAVVGLDYNTEWGGYHTFGTNKIQLNPTAQFQTADGMLEVLSHEHGHLIDDLAPNRGALGEQYSYYTHKIYNDTRDAGYRVALTEQSSYKIGPNVSHEVTGTTHYSYGQEYDLEAAKEAARIVASDLDRKVATYGAVVPAAAGVAVGTRNQVIDAIQNKKDKK